MQNLCLHRPQKFLTLQCKLCSLLDMPSTLIIKVTPNPVISNKSQRNHVNDQVAHSAVCFHRMLYTQTHSLQRRLTTVSSLQLTF